MELEESIDKLVTKQAQLVNWGYRVKENTE